MTTEEIKKIFKQKYKDTNFCEECELPIKLKIKEGNYDGETGN